MPTTLLIHLHVDNQASWATFTPTGHLIESAIHVPLDTIPPHPRPPLVLIPGTEIILAQVDIPSKQWQQIVQAVPYALEEQLADNIENLHFALGKREPLSGDLNVAIIARAPMQAYLQQLNTHGLTPTLLMPDILAVPKPAQGWGILHLDEITLVRTGPYAGFAIETSNLSAALQMALTEHQTYPPPQIVIFNHTQSATTLTELHALGIPITEKTNEQSTLAWLIQGTLENNHLNLLQGYYRPQNKLATLLRPWRLTAALLTLWISLLIAKQTIEYQQMIKQRHTLNQQIEQIYRQTFPQARKIVNPRAQMEQQLQILRTQQQNHTTHTHNFLHHLNQISTPLTRTPGLKLKRLDYRQGRFDIHLEVANLQALEHLKQRLSRLNFTVEIQSATSRNQLVETQLRLQPSPSK